ncbi:MAG: GNAT family N-acetyltransferase [Cyanobacteria bacterium SZAS LIN-2]|nr:GNAT family N-acetyltransferase [Cyanobacteria bacterium SZAS LIN-2]
MQFRRAQTQDLNALVVLQNKNSIMLDAALDTSEGFLSSAFTAEDFAAINNDAAIIVCVDEQSDREGGRLLGFVCASTPAFNQRAGLPAAMLARFEQINFAGGKMADRPCVITGPVCVDKESRGSGIFSRLYQALFQQLSELYPGRFELAVALVSTSNPRSLAAHKKIGMVEVDQFVFNDKTYNTIAMAIAPSVG